MDTQERNADDIRTLTVALTTLTREMGENNQKTAQAIEKADEARDELQTHIEECNEVNRRLERTLWGLGVVLAGLGVLDKFPALSALLGL